MLGRRLLVNDRMSMRVRASDTLGAGNRVVSGVEGEARTKVLEALLATRIRVAKTGTELIAVRFRVLHEGQYPLLDLKYRRTTARRSCEAICTFERAMGVSW